MSALRDVTGQQDRLALEKAVRSRRKIYKLRGKVSRLFQKMRGTLPRWRPATIRATVEDDDFT